MRTNKERLDKLQELSDAAHQEATEWLFKFCREMRAYRDACRRNAPGAELHYELTNEDIHRLAWVDDIFEGMSALDELREKLR